MDAHTDAGLGDHPEWYRDATVYRADIRRIAQIVAADGGYDFDGVEEYAQAICARGRGAASVLAYSTASPNIFMPMDHDSPLYAIACFQEDVGDEVDELCQDANSIEDTETVAPTNGDAIDERVEGSQEKKELSYYVFLNDGDTYSSLDGCLLVGFSETNRRARQALDQEDFETLFDHADVVESITVMGKAPMTA